MADFAAEARDPATTLNARDENATNTTVGYDLVDVLGERDEVGGSSASARNQCEEEVP